MERKKIGTCGVDAGCLIIIDPCYLKYLPDTDKDWEERWCEDILTPTHTPKQGGQVDYGGGGVVVSTGNDGVFPVYAYYDEDGCITKVEILFSQE